MRIRSRNKQKKDGTHMPQELKNFSRLGEMHMELNNIKILRKAIYLPGSCCCLSC